MAENVFASFYHHVSNHIVSDASLGYLGKNAFPQCTSMDHDNGNRGFGRHRRCKSDSAVAVRLCEKRRN